MSSTIKNYDEFQWRNSAYPAKLGLLFMSIDARAFLPVLGMIHISKTTFYIFIASLCFFALLEYRGLAFMVALRRFRAVCAGKKRYIRKTSIRRKRFLHG